MKKQTAITTTVVALSAMLLAACPGPQQEDYRVTGDYLTGKAAKREYNAYMGTAPKDLDARKSQSGDVISHIANFEDCLLMNDGYGILRKSLAATATKNADDTEFSFTIKDNIPWVQSDGTQYEYRGTKQYVTAKDFETTAKQILNYNTGSEIYYMYTLFIKNAWEYYCYTMMTKRMADNVKIYGYTPEQLKESKQLQAEVLTRLVKEYSNADPDTPITEDRIAKIANFSEVGVNVKNGVLTYTLNQKAPFFPTMLTYTPYTPLNSHFLDEQKGSYGQKKENILYCGPFICKDFTSESMKYEKNPYYWNKDYVHIDKVNYVVADASLGYADQRKAFHEGRVDGFGLNKQDEVGWNQYIAGPDGTGTIQNPYSELVNNRELDDIDYTYHFVLNPNRSLESASYANSQFYKNYGTDEAKQADIANTNKALQLQDVRKLILHGFDLASYNEYYRAPERDQYQMNTFTPRGYVYDQSGIDYVDYYYAYFAEQKGLVNEGDAFDDKVAAGKTAVGPQQIEGVNYTTDAEILAKFPWLNADTMVNRAKTSVQLYNSTHSGEEIQFPINIEFLGVGALDADSALKEQKAVQSWNERANACTISQARSDQTGLPLCTRTDSKGQIIYDTFYMRLSNASSSDALSTQANNGYYTIYTGWGWMGDYADPLTYVHCYAVNGEMAKMSGNNNVDLLSYRLNEAGDELTEEKLYDAYTKAVANANEQRDSLTNRYQEFAKVEYMLLNDLYIMRPSAMYTQGWTASVSRAAGYENPQAHYGLADHILAGMWVLTDVPTGAERKEAREKREAREKLELEAVGGNAINGAFMD